MRISGLFRDTFPNLSNMIDEGVRTVAALDEAEDSNYLAANVRRDTAEADVAVAKASLQLASQQVAQAEALS